MIQPKGHIGLQTPTRLATNDDIKELKALKKRLQAAFNSCPNALAVASNQVDLNLPESPTLSAFLYQNRLYINPYYTPTELEPDNCTEECLSNTGCLYTVCRYASIVVGYWLIKGDQLKFVQRALKDVDAQVFQHETDHLRGLGLWDSGTEVPSSMGLGLRKT